MGRKLTSYNGEDKIYTPIPMAQAIIDYFNPTGVCLEPCKGKGAFLQAFINHGNCYVWCEITEGIDFFDLLSSNAEWCFTNPPFSKVGKFLTHTMELGVPNIVFLVTINTIWMNGKLNTLSKFGYQLSEICLIESPYFRRLNGWKQSGFSLGVLYIKKSKEKFPIKHELKVSEIKW